MSSKINVLEIIKGHIGTVSDGGRSFFWDVVTFYIFPLIVSLSGILLAFDLPEETISLLVNFSAIFTALLLSVLVLVYEQESRLEINKKTDELYSVKKALLKDLYYNICFSIVSSLFLVVVCLLHSIMRKKYISIEIMDFSVNVSISTFLLTPIALFVVVSLMLTILMIVKRMHTLLTC